MINESGVDNELKEQGQTQEIGFGIEKAIEIPSNQVSFPIQSFSNDIQSIELGRVGESGQQKDNKQESKPKSEKQNNQNVGIENEDSVKNLDKQIYQGLGEDLPIYQDQKTKQLEQLRVKQQQLLQQLKDIRLKQKQLLGDQDSPTNQIKNQDNSQLNQMYGKEEQQQSVERERKEGQDYEEDEPEYIFSSKAHEALTLSPVKLKRRYFNQKKKKVNQAKGSSELLIGEINREDFQKKVKQIAEHIRSKVQKRAVFVKESKEPKGSIKIQLPEIKRKYLVKDSNLKQKEDGDKLILSVQRKKQEKKKKREELKGLSPELSEQEIKINNVHYILDIIMKKTFDLIAYREKYPLKLDPTQHRYPLTSFRKRVIEEQKKEKEKRYMSESLRVSALHKRKQILNKTNNK